MAKQAVREFGRALAEEPVENLRALFAESPLIAVHSTSSNSLDELIEWVNETRQAIPSVRFDHEIVAVNDKNEGILVGYLIGAHEGQWRGTAPKEPPLLVRMQFCAMVVLDQHLKISQLYANCDREHGFEQCQVLKNAHCKIETEIVSLDDRVIERSEGDEVLSDDHQRANVDATILSCKMLVDKDCSQAIELFSPNVVVRTSKAATRDLGFIRAGFTARFNLEDYEHDVERAFACGRFVASHRTVRFKNPSKAWASSSSAPDIVSSSTTSVALFDDSHRITELWQVGDGVAVQEQLYGAKIGTPIELPKRNSTFPISAEEVTAEWLTNAIVPQPARDQGVKVSSFTFGGVGEIHGYAGLASMVNDIQYEGHYEGEHELPSRVFIKFPLPHTNPIRAVLKEPMLYKREVVCYRHVLPQMQGISYPKAMAIEYDEETDDFVLLLENLNTYYTVGDQVASCDLRYAKDMMRQLGIFHGTWWESPSLDEPELSSFKNIVETAPRIKNFIQVLPVVEDYFKESFTEQVSQRVKKLVTHVEALYRSFKPHKTLSHGDFRLDNMFLLKPDSPASLPDVVLIDYQVMSVSDIVNDLTSFFLSNLSPELMKGHRDELFQLYVDHAIASGAKWSREEFQEEFRKMMLVGIAISLGNCAALVSQSKSSGSSFEPRIVALLDELGRRVLAACEIDEFFEYLDQFEATQSSSTTTAE